MPASISALRHVRGRWPDEQDEVQMFLSDDAQAIATQIAMQIATQNWAN
ncbi:MAG: hypothetical protein AAGF24_03435 [Cyanobacteria bacterium P01_H01_bin.121]